MRTSIFLLLALALSACGADGSLRIFGLPCRDGVSRVLAFDQSEREPSQPRQRIFSIACRF